MTDNDIIKQIKDQEFKQYQVGYFSKWDIDNVMIPFKSMVDRFLKRYNLEDGKEFNIGANHITFGFIVNHINKRIKQAANKGVIIRKGDLELTSQLYFDSNSYKWKFTTVKVVQYMLLFSNDIFIKSDCYVNIIDYISNPPIDVKSTLLKFLKEELSGATNFSVGMVDGKDMDLSFLFSNNFFSIQNLECSNVSEQEKGYTITGTNEYKQYNTNYLSFIDKDNNIYLFKNINVSIGDYDGEMSYFIPKSDLSKKSN